MSDLVEVAADTDPTDPDDNPQQNGDFVFVVPYQGEPDPDQDDLDFSTVLKKVDLYVLMDLSGSMNDEATAVRSNLSTVVRLHRLRRAAPAGRLGDRDRPRLCLERLLERRQLPGRRQLRRRRRQRRQRHRECGARPCQQRAGSTSTATASPCSTAATSGSSCHPTSTAPA